MPNTENSVAQGFVHWAKESRSAQRGQVPKDSKTLYDRTIMREGLEFIFCCNIKMNSGLVQKMI